ncbi:LuxR C-terminal-related transcriptional regulator [Acetobacter sp. TBRC 12305]|uniref:HTH luxR-type domain-containing protein n=1 Tax=Acetobacter garciniae TaxID=2817435 RepID=A0A939HIL3_9PROT|nr:LuxR C-terminal-related transcriptional regulator [Acetobacter garciniae]MBO1325085.1 hypothetical protein [Acetobacter garciniae]MBX0344944.1 LuxR C-terminal-related transcriptional regulator [Acetobacter garciniae]
MPIQAAPDDMRLANQMLCIGESSCVADLAKSLRVSLAETTWSSALGLYMFNGSDLQNLLCLGVPEGFVAEYRDLIGSSDPLLQNVLAHRSPVDGRALLGAKSWSGSSIGALLLRWNLHHHMCGPIFFDGQVKGIIYTASIHPTRPYTASSVAFMDCLCRAASLAMARLNGCSAGPAPHQKRPVLAGRARDVSLLLCKGATNKEIARCLDISAVTVKEHVQVLFRKFGCRNRTELVSVLSRSYASELDF